MKYFIGKIIGYAIAIPIWIILTASIIPLVVLLLICVSIITRDWNWKRMLLEATPQRYVVLPHRHRLRELDEYDLELVRRISVLLGRRTRPNKVNWKRDGF
jgi:hypothetical protein